jgi:hypothetical protein
MRTRRYRIIVSGQLGEIDRGEFEDLRIERHGVDTALIGELDQPALRGVMDRIMMSDLELKGLSLLAEETS